VGGWAKNPFRQGKRGTVGKKKEIYLLFQSKEGGAGLSKAEGDSEKSIFSCKEGINEKLRE